MVEKMPEKKEDIHKDVAAEHGLMWNYTGVSAQLWLSGISPDQHGTEELNKAISYLERVPKENEEEIYLMSSGKKYDWTYHSELVKLIKTELDKRETMPMEKQETKPTRRKRSWLPGWLGGNR